MRLKHEYWLEYYIYERNLLGSANKSIPCKHVDLPLIHTQLANVSFQEKHIGCLHTRIEDLGSTHLISLLATHDSAASLNTGKIIYSAQINAQSECIERMTKQESEKETVFYYTEIYLAMSMTLVQYSSA